MATTHIAGVSLTEVAREFIMWKMFPKITFEQLIKEINSQLEYYQAEYNRTHQLLLKLKNKLETFERRCS